MATQMTQNGVSTTTALGEERSETFKNRGKKYVQYDYRDTDGELFSTVQKTLQQCRVARDKWLTSKQGKND